MSESLGICIVSHNGYGALTGRPDAFVGGVERQTSLLARWLAEHGHRVSFLTWNEGGDSEEIVEGIRVIKICNRNGGLPALRFVYPKWTGLIAALRRADADVYYHNCGECVTGQIALWCRRNAKAFVFTAANDTDCDPRLPGLKYARDRALYRMGLQLADRIVVQTETQREMLKHGFGLESTVIPMPGGAPATPPPVKRLMPTSDRMLWLARVCPQKRPDRLVELARACPEFRFDLAGPHYQDALSRKAIDEAATLGNVTIHGSVSRERVWRMLGDAACLVCTSDYEGFPNTFLEAWSRGIPVVSTFDPDHVIESNGLGAVARNVAGLAAALRRLMGNPADYAAASENALAYFQRNHALEKVQPRFESIITGSVRDSGRNQGTWNASP